MRVLLQSVVLCVVFYLSGNVEGQFPVYYVPANQQPYFTPIEYPAIYYYNVTPTANSHHLQVGSVGRQDVLLYKHVHHKNSKFMGYAHEDVIYPPKGVLNNITISCVRALDRYVNGKGGYARIKNGGVAHTNVTIYLESQYWRGYDFEIQIWGRPDSKFNYNAFRTLY